MDRQLLQAALFSLILIATGCAPVGQPMQKSALDLDDSQTTGGVKVFEKSRKGKKEKEEVQLPYTIAGSSEIFDQIRTEVSPQSDKITAKQIKTVHVIGNGPRFLMTIEFLPEAKIHNNKLDFDVQLSTSSGILSTKDTPARIDTSVARTHDFKADVTCYEKCKILDIRLKKTLIRPTGTQKPEDTKVIGILYRESEPKVSVRADSQEADSTVATDLQKSLEDRVQMVSVTVLDGPSKYEIKNKNMQLTTDAVDTAEGAIRVSDAQLTNNKDLEVELGGNDPDTGSIILNVTDKTKKTTASLIIENEAIQPLKPKPAQPTQPLFVPSPNRKSLFPNPPLGANTQAARINKALDDYANDPEVQRMIRVVTGKEKNTYLCPTMNTYSIQRLEKFIAHVPPLVPHIEKVMSTLDLPADVAYLLTLESEYAQNAEYYSFSLTSDRKSSALGPWQIVDITAKHIKEKLSPIAINYTPVLYTRAPSQKDDRTYFLNSTYMAGLLLKSLFNRYSQDPAMAFMAYHAGESDADKVMRMTQSARSLKEIFKFRVQTKTGNNCKHIVYALNFLSARTIGQNLEVYNLQNIPVTTSKKFEARLRNPISPLPAGI